MSQKLISLLTTAEPFFFFFITLGLKAKRHTADYMATKMEDQMAEKIIEIFGAAVIDNESVMAQILLISEGRYSHIAVCTCAPHTPHLIIYDIIKLRSISIYIYVIHNN